MRVKHHFMRFQSAIIRITPAHAGKTPKSDHVLAITKGSPPRMRVKLLSNSKLHQQCGITPAHAGKTQLKIVHCS